MEEKTMDNVAENEIEKMEDLGQALEESYAHMGNGEYDTDTLLAWEKINEYKKINPEIRTYLGASKGKESFYEKFGFISRPNEELGAGMILYDDQKY